MSNFVILGNRDLPARTMRGGDRVVYTLEAAAEIAEMHPDMVRYYCKSGLFGPGLAKKSAELFFDDDAIYELRRIEHYRRHFGVNRSALPLVSRLLRDVARLEAQLRIRGNP